MHFGDRRAPGDGTHQGGTAGAAAGDGGREGGDGFSLCLKKTSAESSVQPRERSWRGWRGKWVQGEGNS